MSEPETMMINKVKYIREDTLKQEQASTIDGMEYCIVRTYSSGVFAGYIKRKPICKLQTIFKSRRIWKWEGAASLSQLSVDGTKKPDGCKLPCEVPETDLTEVIEVIPCSKIAEESIKGVPIWQQ